jgi:hypothetical protein
MADTNTKGVFTLGDVRSRQAANAWPVVGVSTEASTTQSANTVGIGDTINFYTNTNGRLIPGQILYWAINSNTNAITSADFVDNSINGTISANTKGEIVLSKNISSNFRDGDVIFNIKLLAGSLNGTVIATTSNVQINKTPPTVPGAPTIGTAYANGTTGANVTYTAPANSGRSTILSYTATANVGGISATVYQSGSGLISLTGLSTGVSYSFTVTATNAVGTSIASSVSNPITPLVPPGSQSFTTAGTYSFIPTSTSVSVVAVGGGGGGGYTWSSGGGGGGGLGYKNNYPVTPGTPYTVVVGAGGPSTPNAQNAAARGCTSYFIDTSTVAGYGGGQGGPGSNSPAPGYGGGYTGDGGGRGGNGAWDGSWNYGGAGAGGYAGAGADTYGNPSSTGIAAPAGGGGGGGGWYSSTYGVPAGGGVGILGQGCPGGKVNSNYYGGLGGSGGAQGTGGEGSGQSSLRGITGGAYGGGGGGSGTSYGGGNGGVGAVRIIWGAGRAFPTTNVSSP